MTSYSLLSNFFEDLEGFQNLTNDNTNMSSCTALLKDNIKVSNFTNVAKATSHFENQPHLQKIIHFFEKYLINFRKDLNPLISLIFENKGLKFPSPYTGEYVLSNVICGDNIFIFHTDEGGFIVSFSSPWKSGFNSLQVTLLKEKSCLHISTSQVIEEINGWYFADLGRVLLRMRQGRLSFLKDGFKDKKVIITNYNYPHIGHNLWNGISAWGAVDRTIGNPDQFVSQSVCYDTYIYGALNCESKIIEEFDLKAELPFFIKNNFISNDVAQSIVSRSINSYDFAIHKFSLPKNLFYTRYLVVNIRIGNRSVLNYKEFYSSLVTRLLNSFPRYYLIIDGMNTSKVVSSSTHKGIDLDDEITLGKELCSLEPARVFSVIGSTISENISVIQNALAVVAPWGAGLAKHCWISNLPAVLYSSSSILRSRDDLRIYDTEEFREGAKEAMFLDPDLVEDFTEGALSANGREGFLIRKDGVEELVKLLEIQISKHNKCTEL